MKLSTNKPRFLLFVISASMFMMLITACGSQAPAVNQAPADDQPQEVESAPTGAAEVADAPTTEAVVTLAPASTQDVSYSTVIYPILENSCVECHGVEKVSRGLNLTSYDKMMTGSVRGPVIVSGDAANSSLYKAVASGKMPKEGAKLTPEQVELIKAWIELGAPNN